MPLKLSVVVPNHDYSRFLPRFFASLAAQTLGLDAVEVRFVDDKSSDDSLDVAMQIGQDLACAHFAAVPLERQGRPGPVRNAGLTRAKAGLLLCLDPDDLLAPEYLATLVAVLEAEPGLGFAYTDFVLAEENGPTREVRLPEFDPALLRTQNIVAPTAMFRRAVWEQSRGFRRDTAYEDWDFWVQAAANGFAGRRIPRALYTHCVHGANFSNQARLEDGPAKALIVRDNEAFFPAKTRQWARALLAREAWAAPLSRGIIPRPQDVDALLAAFSAEVEKRRKR